MTLALLVWLFDTTIKGSLMILLVVSIQRLIGQRVDARWRHLLWVVVLLRLILPDLPSSRFSLFNLLPQRPTLLLAPPPFAVADVVAGAPGQMLPRTVVSFEAAPMMAPLQWALWIWLAGVALFALRTLIASVRTWRAVRMARRDALRIVSPIPIVECDFVRTPALHGLFRPVLLLPRGFNQSFTAGELRHVVVHELWHLRRMDVAVSWLLSAAQTVHWFNPFVWFAASKIREERELSCDELALSYLEEEERLGYGRTILKLLERFRAAAPVPALVGIVNEKQKMKRRLTMIASFRNRTRITTLFLVLVAAVGVMGLTNAQGGQKHRLMKKLKLDPAAAAMHERLGQKVTLQLTNASLNDVLAEVSSKTGLTVTQEPAVATSAAQKARFTIKADNVPAHAVLMESLMPFELSAEPTESGVTITEGKGDRIMLRHVEPAADGAGVAEEDVVIVHGSSDDKEHTFKITERKDGTPGETTERVFVKRLVHDQTFDEAGKFRRELTINLEENGVKSEGKMTIEIQK